MTTPIIKPTWFINFQSDKKCPDVVKEEIGKLWEENELMNDTSILKTDMNELLSGSWNVPNLAKYVQECLPKDIPMDELIVLHFWW